MYAYSLTERLYYGIIEYREVFLMDNKRPFVTFDTEYLDHVIPIDQKIQPRHRHEDSWKYSMSDSGRKILT